MFLMDLLIRRCCGGVPGELAAVARAEGMEPDRLARALQRAGPQALRLVPRSLEETERLRGGLLEDPLPLLRGVRERDACVVARNRNDIVNREVFAVEGNWICGHDWNA